MSPSSPATRPFLGALAEGETRVYLPDGSVQRFDVAAGFVEVSNDTVSILVS